MTVKELFDFVIDQSIADEDVDDYLEKVFPCIIYSVSFSESFRPDRLYKACLFSFYFIFFPLPWKRNHSPDFESTSGSAKSYGKRGDSCSG